jgi:hypothetical protein
MGFATITEAENAISAFRCHRRFLVKVKMPDNLITVSILNFQKFNPRKDSKRPTWFRMEHDLFEDSKFFDFSDSELRVWLYLLCRASREGVTGKVTVNVDHAYRVGSISKESLYRTLKKLQERRVLTIHSHAGRFETLRDLPATNDTDVTDDTLRTNERDEKPLRRPAAVAQAKESKTFSTWKSYSDAYRKRHGAYPIRNAKISSQLSQFVDRVGIEDAPEIAAFFLTHNDAFYTRSKHPVGLLVRDAEKLHTEWKTGKVSTGIEAKQAEKTSAFMAQIQRIENGEA